MLNVAGKKISFDNSKNNKSSSKITAFSAQPGVTFSYKNLQYRVGSTFSYLSKSHHLPFIYHCNGWTLGKSPVECVCWTFGKVANNSFLFLLWNRLYLPFKHYQPRKGTPSGAASPCGPLEEVPLAAFTHRLVQCNMYFHWIYFSSVFHSKTAVVLGHLSAIWSL